MRIGIDTQTTLGQKTGFGFYVKNLISNLKKIDKTNEYFFFQPNFERDLSTPQRLIWDQYHIPLRANKAKVDILHQPCFSNPVFYSGKTVVTIHDLIALLYGKDIPFWSRQYFGHWMPLTYRRANKIICDSENTKKDVMKFLHIPEEKLRVIYLATDEEFDKEINRDQIESVKKKYLL